MSKSPKPHHSDHSGAHAHGTHYHQKHAHTTDNAHSGDEAEDHELQMDEKPMKPEADMAASPDSGAGNADTSESMPSGGQMTGDGTQPD